MGSSGGTFGTNQPGLSDSFERTVDDSLIWERLGAKDWERLFGVRNNPRALRALLVVNLLEQIWPVFWWSWAG